MHTDDREALKEQLTILTVATLSIKGWIGDDADSYDRVLAHLEEDLIKSTAAVKAHREKRLAAKESIKVQDRRATFTVVK